MRNVHPVQPGHAATASHATQPGTQATGATPHPTQPTKVGGKSPRKKETLGHAIDRMLDQGWSEKKVEGQVHRWNPHMSPTHIRSMVRAADNPVAKRGRLLLPETSNRATTTSHASFHTTPNSHHKSHSWLGGVAGDIGGGFEWAGKTAARGEGWAEHKEARGAKWASHQVVRGGEWAIREAGHGRTWAERQGVGYARWATNEIAHGRRLATREATIASQWAGREAIRGDRWLGREEIRAGEWAAHEAAHGGKWAAHEFDKHAKGIAAIASVLAVITPPPYDLAFGLIADAATAEQAGKSVKHGHLGAAVFDIATIGIFEGAAAGLSTLGKQAYRNEKLARESFNALARRSIGTEILTAQEHAAMNEARTLIKEGRSAEQRMEKAKQFMKVLGAMMAVDAESSGVRVPAR